MFSSGGDEIATAWRALSNTTAVIDGWQSISLSDTNNIKLRAGCHYPGREEALLIGFDSISLPSAFMFPEGKGFKVEKIEVDDSKEWIALVRQTQGNADLFFHMVIDIFILLSSTESTNQNQLFKIFLSRVIAWKEFMKNDQNSLSPEQELGLVGELSLLNELLDQNLAHSFAIDAWKGPFDGVQDFELGNGAIEVKSTLSVDGFPASIFSLEQLDDSIRNPLFIFGCRFICNENGLSLSEHINEIRKKIINDSTAFEKFNNALLKAGYFDMHRDKYIRKFELANHYILHVNDQFPRLTFGNIPKGIFRVRYDIDLSALLDTRISLSEALKLLGVL